jgi:hypothetical protein
MGETNAERSKENYEKHEGERLDCGHRDRTDRCGV